MLVLECPECGLVFGSGRALFWHLVMEHKYSSDDAYDFIGGEYQRIREERG